MHIAICGDEEEIRATLAGLLAMYWQEREKSYAKAP